MVTLHQAAKKFLKVQGGTKDDLYLQLNLKIKKAVKYKNRGDVTPVELEHIIKLEELAVEIIFNEIENPMSDKELLEKFSAAIGVK